MWRYEFEEYGGYDCLSSAYVIYKGEEIRFSIDTRNFPSYDSTCWATKHLPLKEAETLAKSLVDHLNKEFI